MADEMQTHGWIPNPYDEQQTICQHCGASQKRSRIDVCYAPQTGSFAAEVAATNLIPPAAK